MKSTLNKILVLLLVLFITSCTVYTKSILKEGTRKDRLVIKGYVNTHCPCMDIVAFRYEGRKLQYIFVTDNNIGPAGKTIYTYDSNGKVTWEFYPVSYDASPDIEFSEYDKFIISKINNYIASDSAISKRYRLSKLRITGFKKQNK